MVSNLHLDILGLAAITTTAAATTITGISRLLFCMSENMRFEVCRLGELFIASVEGADVGPVTGVDPDVGPKVEVEREPLAAALEGALEGFLAGVHQLVALELGALHEGLAALGAHVDARPVGVEVLPHRRIVTEHLGAALVGAGDGAGNLLHPRLSLRLDPCKFCQLLWI